MEIKFSLFFQHHKLFPLAMVIMVLKRDVLLCWASIQVIKSFSMFDISILKFLLVLLPLMKQML